MIDRLNKLAMRDQGLILICPRCGLDSFPSVGKYGVKSPGAIGDKDTVLEFSCTYKHIFYYPASELKEHLISDTERNSR